jgi:hypothetical protein
MNKKELFWGLMKKQIPVIIILAIINSILGIYASHMYSKSKAITKKIKKDNESITRWMKDMVQHCQNRMSIDELDEKKKPIEPTKILIYDYD